jgi:DNA mismatch repair protein MutS
MAQIGSFIPASNAKISIVDRIFTRVGASDDLAGGESTFMVEMLETANILNNATNNSLLILDEVGRGTSTYDGMALAWAIIEQIVKDIKAKCLFATHYHDLLLLEDLHPMVKNFKVSVLETKDEVSFMHKIEKGGIDKSFGIHVAKLAGIPPKTIKRANQILDELHKKSIKSFIEKHKLIDTQLGFNVEPATLQNPILNELNELDINTLSPLEALNKLQEIKKKLSNEGN